MQTAGAATVALNAHPEVLEFRQRREKSQQFETAPDYIGDAATDADASGSILEPSKYRFFWEGIQRAVDVQQQSLLTYQHRQRQQHSSHWRSQHEKPRAATDAAGSAGAVLIFLGRGSCYGTCSLSCW